MRERERVMERENNYCIFLYLYSSAFYDHIEISLDS